MTQNEVLPSKLSCPLGATCSGCPSIETPYVNQLSAKAAELKAHFDADGVTYPESGAFKIRAIDSGRLRDKSDLTMAETASGHHLGLYANEGQGIVDMPACPQMTTALEGWLQDFRKTLNLLKPGQLRRGSVRLRVAPDGRRGVWLDLANVDVKTLLDDQVWLAQLLTLAIVEIGQKRKRLVVKEGVLKLADAVEERWFHTFIAPAHQPVALYSSIAGFSQPGFRANQTLVQELVEMVSRIKALHWLELFCGNGNFTLPLVSLGKRVTAFELDHRAVDALRRSLAEQGLGDNAQVIQGDAYRKSANMVDPVNRGPVPMKNFEALLVDPPRSGLKAVLEWIKAAPPLDRPLNIVYVSCFGPTLSHDGAALQKLGYKMTEVRGVDQFAQSPHCEWLVRFEKEA